MDSRAEEKSSLTLQCQTAQTASAVTWLKGHAELTAGGRYEMSQKGEILTLTIKHLEEEDTDIYTCDVGTTKSMAKVTVDGKYRASGCAVFWIKRAVVGKPSSKGTPAQPLDDWNTTTHASFFPFNHFPSCMTSNTPTKKHPVFYNLILF